MAKKAKETRKCWSCGKNTMVPFDGYWKCRCGATDVDFPHIGLPVIAGKTRDGQSGHATYRSRPAKPDKEE